MAQLAKKRRLNKKYQEWEEITNGFCDWLEQTLPMNHLSSARLNMMAIAGLWNHEDCDDHIQQYNSYSGKRIAERCNWHCLLDIFENGEDAKTCVGGICGYCKDTGSAWCVQVRLCDDGMTYFKRESTEEED